MNIFIIPVFLLATTQTYANEYVEVVRHPTKIEYIKIINKSAHFHTCSIDSEEGYYYMNLYPKSKSSWYPASILFKYKCRPRIKKYN
jgi:hypothetical protein